MPAEFDLVRVSVRPEGAFGVFLQDGFIFALTLERTYDSEGRTQLVKIPTGTWPCRRSYFYGGGHETFEVQVPGFSRLLFHKGNTERDSEGCILVGTLPGYIGGEPGILKSSLAFAEFMSRTGGRRGFRLRVREVEP